MTLKPGGLGRTNLVTDEIDTQEAPSIRQRLYRVGSKRREEIDQHVKDVEERDIICPSKSPWSFPCCACSKARFNKTTRFWVDYRALNSVTRDISFPIPLIDEALTSLHGTKYFSTMDLMTGYWQLEMSEEAQEKTAFITTNGLYYINEDSF